jgi:hypothetical protein
VFLKISQPLISYTKAESRVLPGPHLVPGAGRPSLISPDGQDHLLYWLQPRCGEDLWPTGCELKEYISLILEAEKLDSPSRIGGARLQSCPKLISRLVPNELPVCLAGPLEQGRLQVAHGHICDQFARLASLPTAGLHPRLVTNLDETGLGSLKGRRLESKKAVVPKTFKRQFVYQAKLEPHFISVIVAIPLAGDVPSPAFISKRSHQHLDAGQVSHFSLAERCARDRAFMRPRVVDPYLGVVHVSYLHKIGIELGNKTAPRTPVV